VPGQRTFAVILATGSCPAFRACVAKKEVRAAEFRAIGALSDVVLLDFDWTTKIHSRAMLRRRILLAILASAVCLQSHNSIQFLKMRRFARLELCSALTVNPCSG
jgi:hypothetical protein